MITNTSREFKVTFAPDNTTEAKNVTWTSSDENVVSIDSDGVATANAPGGAVVVAQNGSLKAICMITVSDTYDATYEGVDYSSVFDPYYYADTNEDVKNAFGYDTQALISHFVNFGMGEGRCAKETFNVVEYKYGIYNADLRSAFGGDMKQYYYHYMNFGKNEGRSVSDWDAVFDPEYYLAANPDVYDNIVSRFTSDGNTKGWALWHFCEFGMNEGRIGKADFGVFNYMAANADVYQAFAPDYSSVYLHYVLYGIPEHRSITPKYNMYQMATQRPDVVEAFGNNIVKWVEWYIEFGSKGY